MINFTPTKPESDLLKNEINKYEIEKNKVREVKNSLDKDAFMKLLVEEMKYQDPLSPIDNKEMMSQLAGFSSLEQMENLNEKAEKFLDSLKANKLTEGVNYLGKYVQAHGDDGSLIEGVVQSARLDNGTLKLNVNGQEIMPSNIITISINND